MTDTATTTDAFRARWDNIGRRMLDGDESALRELMTVFGPRLTAYVGRRLGNADDADDLMSRAYERLWRKRELWDPTRGSYLAWARTILRNMITDAYRARASRSNSVHQVLVHDLDDWMTGLPDESRPDLLDDMDREEELDRVMRWMDELNANHRRALLMRARDEMAMADVATATNANENTVKVWIFRAKQTLRARRAAYDAAGG